jgi:hypothetical protein
LDEGELRACLFDEANPIASVRAAWERLLRSMPAPKDVNAFTKADPARSQHFVGFVEGRLNIDLPGWWEGAVRSARHWENDGTSFSVPGRMIGLERVPSSWRLVGENGPWVHRRIETAEWTGEKRETLVLRLAGDRPRQEFRLSDAGQHLWAYGRINAIKTGTSIIFETQGFDCQRFPLAAFDPQTGALKWKTTVWAARPMGHSGPPLGDHWTELVVRDGVLYVIGAGTDAVYIEGFQVDNGAPKFRFSSAY